MAEHGTNGAPPLPKASEASEELSRHTPACVDVSETLARVSDKWSVPLVLLLRGGTRRFGELTRLVPAISQRMLTLTLRGLERDGFVKRTFYPAVPPRVDYELTPLGHSLSKPIEALGDWAKDHEDKVRAARREFDAKSDDRNNGISGLRPPTSA